MVKNTVTTFGAMVHMKTPAVLALAFATSVQITGEKANTILKLISLPTLSSGKFCFKVIDLFYFNILWDATGTFFFFREIDSEPKIPYKLEENNNIPQVSA